MFHITILAVGRLKERYLAEAAAEYLKRLRAYAKVDVVEVGSEGFTESLILAGRQKVIEKEGERLLSRLRPGTFPVALDLKGEMISSEEMAGVLDKLALGG